MLARTSLCSSGFKLSKGDSAKLKAFGMVHLAQGFTEATSIEQEISLGITLLEIGVHVTMIQRNFPRPEHRTMTVLL